MGGTISRMELLTYGESFCLVSVFFSLLLSGFSFQPSSCSSPIARLRLHIIHSTRASLVQLLSCLLKQNSQASHTSSVYLLVQFFLPCSMLSLKSSLSTSTTQPASP